MQRTILIFICFPLIVFAQTICGIPNTDLTGQHNLFPYHSTENPNTKLGPRTEHFDPLFNRNGVQQTFRPLYFSANLIGKKLSRIGPQENSDPSKSINLPAFGNAGNYLRTSMWMQYAANGMSILVPLIGYKKETTYDTQGWYGDKKEETKLTGLGYVLTIGATASSLFSFYKAGQTGSVLYSIGNRMPPEAGISLSETGRRLQSFRTLSFISSGLGLVVNFMLVSSINDLKEDNEDVSISKISTATGMAIASLILKIIAVNNVDKSGNEIEKFSRNMEDGWKKNYFTESSKHLKKYNQRWDQGLSLIFGGVGIALAGGLIAAQSDAPAALGTGASILGGVMAFAGYIYMNWLAPAELGAAGQNMKDFELRMQRNQ